MFKAAERIMAMDEATWARHASPWSVYSRFSVMPLLALAIWSRVWLGWGALVPVALVLAWTWLNPRLFSKPDTTDSWASHVVLGERVFLARAEQPIPANHAAWSYGLGLLSALGLAPFAYGLWALDLGWTLCGIVLVMVGKAWFCDRMAWLWQDMRALPGYARWHRPRG